MFVPVVTVNIEKDHFAAFKKGHAVPCRLGGSSYYSVQVRVPVSWVMENGYRCTVQQEPQQRFIRQF